MRFTRKNKKMRKKTLIHFSIFLPLTLIFTGLSVLGFSKTANLGEEFEVVKKEINDISVAESPLTRTIQNNNKIINNDDKIYYCENCKNFYDSSYAEFEYNGTTYHDACQRCSDFESSNIVYLVSSAAKKEDLKVENASLAEQIAIYEENKNAALKKQENISDMLNKYMSISIISTPIALVLLLIMVFARKE